MKAVVAFFALACLPITAIADQWLPATPRTYSSENGRYRLTVFPRQLRGALPYFEDKVDGKINAGQLASGQAACEATLEKLVGNRYEQLWRKPLVNDVSPLSALVSDAHGGFVTFDNWHSMGWGDDAIAVYSGAGKLLKKYALTDIMTSKQFEGLPRSVSSIWWSGEHRLSDHRDIVEVQVVKNGEMDIQERKYRVVQIRLRDGSVIK